jgi:hypothetical protein
MWPDYLDIVAGSKLVRVVSLACVYDRYAVSDKLVHAVVAGADAHLGDDGRIDCFFDKALTKPMRVVYAVVRLHELLNAETVFMPSGNG